MASDNLMQYIFNEQSPYNLEAEQSVLGSIIIDSETIPIVMEKVREDFFFVEQHKLIYNCITLMYNSAVPIDFITILDKLKAKKLFNTEDEAKLYLTRLIDAVPSTSNIEYYCEILKNNFYARELISISKEAINNALSSSDINSAIDLAEQRIFDIRQSKMQNGLVNADQLVLELFDKLQTLANSTTRLPGLPTGFTALDNILTGLNKSDLILIAARPGMGKTSFALNIAINSSIKAAKDIAVFSLEMSKEQIIERMLSCEARIDNFKLRTGDIKEDEWVRIVQGSEILYQSNIYLDDTPAITTTEVKSKVRSLKNLGLIIIDYLQLMSSGKRIDNRVLEISEITRNLKIMAKQLSVPVIVLSQLSRAPDARADHRPMLSDLRESGSIEQDADIVLFLYREHYYNKEEAPENVAECIIAKNRHGETNTVQLAWEGRYTRFGNLELNRHE